MKYFSPIILVLSLLLHSCAEDFNNPGGIIPPEDLLNAIYTDTTTIRAYIEKDDTVFTHSSYRGLLGSYYDPVFGKTTSSFYTTVNTSFNQVILGGNRIVDSVFLVLRADGVYGDATKFNSYQVAEVFEVTQEIPIPGATDDGYSSYNSFFTNPIPIGIKGFAPQFYPYGNEPAQLRIPINNSIGQRFLVLDTIKPDTIKYFLNGLYVRISPTTTADQSVKQGGICYFNLSSDISKLVIYFHSDATAKGQINLVTSGTNNVHFSVYNHDFNSSTDPDFLTKLNDTTDTTGDYLYLQSIQGIRTKVLLPYFLNYVDTQKVILNKAELIIPIDINQDLTLYPPSSNVMNYRYNDDGLIQLFPDLPYAYYDSFYDPVNQQFRVVITQYLQKVLTGEYPNDGFYLDIPIGNKNTDAYRVVIHSPEHPTAPMKLNLVYTRIQN